MFVTGRILNISKYAAHRSIHRAMEIVSRQFDNFIKFPADLNPVKRKFQSKYHLPDVIGAIDGAHIPIQRVSSNVGLI